MKIKLFFLGLLGLILVGCGRSKESQWYVLNPLPALNVGLKYAGLKIGIQDLSIPAYLDKTQLLLFYTPNQAMLYENHEWAEDLAKNTKRVLRTNLTTLLPGAIIELSPWDSKFKPDYFIQLNINQWKVDAKGQSLLTATYLIFDETRPLRQRSITYQQLLTKVTPETMVASMNSQLTQLSEDIAKRFIKYSKQTKEPRP